jgi:glycosyltransferase involved in cell wall biosynthesis
MSDLLVSEPSGRPAQKRIVVTFFGNPMIRSDGCHVRVLEMLHFLSSAGFELTFYSFQDYPVWPWSDRDIAEFKKTFSGVRLKLDRWGRCADFFRRSKNAICSFMPQVSPVMARLTIPGIMPEWSKIKRDHTDAIYLVNYVDGLTQLNGIDLSRVIVDTHDLLFLAYSIVKDIPVWRSCVLRRFRREISFLDETALVITIALNEKILFDLLLKRGRVCYVPPHMARRAKLKKESATEADLLFLGSSNYKNIRGINSFLSDYCNWQTSSRLIIAGNVSEHIDPEFRELPSIEIKGYVQDLSLLYGCVRAAICPVEGTGVNLKVLEALAFGKPVFACSSAIAGLPPGSETCVFPLTEEAVRTILADRGRLEQASQAALNYVDSSFIHQSWSALHEKLQNLVMKG